MIKQWVEFGREVRREILKINWPTRKEISVTTMLIFVMATFAAIFFFLVDWGVGKMIKLILGMQG